MVGSCGEAPVEMGDVGLLEGVMGGLLKDCAFVILSGGRTHSDH